MNFKNRLLGSGSKKQNKSNHKGTSMYYVITKGGGGVRKWQFSITFSTKSNP